MDLKEIILDKLAAQPNTVFSVMVNHTLLYNTNSNQLLRVRVERDEHGKRLSFGVYKNVNNFPIFAEITDLYTVLATTLKKSTILGVDFSSDISEENNIPIIEINAISKILHLKTIAYDIALKVVRNRTGSMTFVETGRTMTVEEKGKIATNFVDYSFNNYLVVANQILLKRIKKSFMLSFYNIENAFVPLLISSNELANPFLFNPDISETFSKSLLYSTASRCEKHFSAVQVDFITHLNICKSMGLKKFVKMPFNFIVPIIMGIYSSQYPNMNSFQYLKIVKSGIDTEDYDLIISPEQYRNLSSNDAALYRSYNTLQIHCFKYYRTVGAKSFAELYNYVKGFRLIYA